MTVKQASLLTSTDTDQVEALGVYKTYDTGKLKVEAFSDRELTAFRAREMGFAFQTYNLLPVLTGLENVELPLLVSGVSPGAARARARASIERVGLLDWARHRPAEMSGGQRQRFAIARALATMPSIVWADEPTGALDSTTSQEIIDLMLSLSSACRIALTSRWSLTG